MTKEEKESLENKAGKRRSEKQREADKKAKHWAREWLDALVWAAIAALILRTFFFGAYRIPTPSMEKTLLTGDFLLVSKLAYGARTPMTLSVPFTDIYTPGVNLPWFRIPGLEEVERNEIVVFNYPVDVAPISVKTNYIKRAVGMPGDRLEVREKILYINAEQAEQFGTLMYHHRVEVRERIRLSRAKVREAGAQIVQSGNESVHIINMTTEVADEMKNWAEIKNIELFVLPENFNEFGRRGFNFSRGFQNHDRIPEITIPYEGQEIILTDENWHLYQDILERHERNSVQKTGDNFFINGKETNRYTIQKNYYFMMGDNRDDSEDSRYWGFVPEDHIVGKASIIYFSWDKDRFAPRFGRMLNLIH